MSNTINTAFNTLMSKIKNNFTYLKNKVDGLLSSFNSHSSNTVLHITAAERTEWNNKQAAISDLATIRNGASAGATALQSGDNVSSLTNDAGYLTSHQDISGKANSADLATVATSGSYNDLSNKPTIPDAQIQSDWNQTTTTAKDYIKNKPTIPSVPTNVSAFTNDAGYTTNAGTITGITMNGTNKGTSGVVDLGTVLTSHQDISGKANSADLAIVATSGSYNDLSNKPTIPAAQIQSDWNQTNSSALDYIKNKPSISSVPTNVSAFTNDAGYTTNTGTITGITMNGVNKGTSGVIDLGTVLTSHQDISGKENTSNKVTQISHNSTDNQYPSAKCVYSLIGNIETLLQGV